MTEPTNHRAEAERCLDFASTITHGSSPAVTNALLGAIAHDLHRIADTLEDQTGYCPARNEHDARCAYWPGHGGPHTFDPPDDQPGPGNVEADYTDDGQMIRAPQPPPLVRCGYHNPRTRSQCLLSAGHQGEHAALNSTKVPDRELEERPEIDWGDENGVCT